ncbi:MAG: hypothetical protein ACI85E_001093, partial [Marinomonas primoryensis]
LNSLTFHTAPLKTPASAGVFVFSVPSHSLFKGRVREGLLKAKLSFTYVSPGFSTTTKQPPYMI